MKVWTDFSALSKKFFKHTLIYSGKKDGFGKVILFFLQSEGSNQPPLINGMNKHPIFSIKNC